MTRMFDSPSSGSLSHGWSYGARASSNVPPTDNPSNATSAASGATVFVDVLVVVAGVVEPAAGSGALRSLFDVLPHAATSTAVATTAGIPMRFRFISNGTVACVVRDVDLVSARSRGFSLPG